MPAISITALNDPVAIVHIPIELAETTSSKLYWTLEHAPTDSNEFFNVTSNRIEICIFASTDLINDQWASLSLGDGIRISATWRVFEISSGDIEESGNYDSPHLRHVSAPLSRAGISILYQSSYFTDFLLVKESDFDKASGIFTEQGWHVDPTSHPHRRRSQLMSPITPSSTSSSSPTRPLSSSYFPPVPTITVLPSPLACIGFSKSSERATAERVRQLVVWPEQARRTWRKKRDSLNALNTDLPTPVQSPKLVQSTDDQGDSGVRNTDMLGNGGGVIGRPFLSYTRTEDGASIMTETKILRWMFGRTPNGVEEGEEGGGVNGVEFQLEGPLTAGYDTDSTDFAEDEDDDANDDSDDNDQDDHTHHNDINGSHSTSLFDKSRSRSIDDDESSQQDESQCQGGYHTPPPDQHPPGLYNKRSRPLSLPATPRDSPLPAFTPHTTTHIHSHTHPTTSPTTTTTTITPNPDRIPISWCPGFTGRRSVVSFKSAVGTDEWGQSQGDNNDEEDVRRGGASDKGERGAKGSKRQKVGRKRCLQLDLRGIGEDNEEGDDGVYHMDKSGLVTLFSDLLNASSIRMLYSSTFHTANVLVKANDVARAKKCLEIGSSGRRKSVSE